MHKIGVWTPLGLASWMARVWAARVWVAPRQCAFYDDDRMAARNMLILATRIVVQAAETTGVLMPICAWMHAVADQRGRESWVLNCIA